MTGRDNAPTEPSQAPWRKQVAEHLRSQVSYSAVQRARLRDALLDADVSSSVSVPAALRPTKVWWKRFALDYVAVAVVTAVCVVALLPSQSLFQISSVGSDALSDLLSAPSMRSYPPDFDLEGDATAFVEIVQDVFPADAEMPFQAEFPSHLEELFKPTEGRFFTWAGEPGVSIRLTPAEFTRVSAAGTTSAPVTTLYIIKLNGIAEQKFPKERDVMRLSSRGGKERRVHVWREGNYGYAVVQNSPTATGDFFPE